VRPSGATNSKRAMSTVQCFECRAIKHCLVSKLALIPQNVQERKTNWKSIILAYRPPKRCSLTCGFTPQSDISRAINYVEEFVAHDYGMAERNLSFVTRIEAGLSFSKVISSLPAWVQSKHNSKSKTCPSRTPERCWSASKQHLPCPPPLRTPTGSRWARNR